MRWLKLTRKSKLNLLLSFGWGFLGLGLLVLIRTFSPVISEEIKYRLPANKAKEIIPLDTNLGIVIPKIKANARIVPNVDPYDSRVYQRALTQGVAHARGTVLPGQPGNSFIFSHSSANFYEATRYNSVFYLLNKLEPGDEIEVYFQGEKFVYQVTGKGLYQPEAVSFLSPQAKGQTLTLMTCWPAGTDLKRLIVTAELR